jgi:hypothetical protein
MAAKIGILGESTAVAEGLTTVYTVPADKAARVRLIFAMEGGSSTLEYYVTAGTPGDILITRTTGANIDVFSGMTGAGSIASNTIGIAEGSGILDLGGGGDNIILPYPHDFFLSTGDTVQFRILNLAAVDHLIQVLGVEDDA